ncbi:MAG: hypothetical protein J6U83_00215 [Bacteroidales bacterium]|jgi:hypothetical protein|nr:hypothetical protein [Bacteroidales bacterium]MBQ5827264.1 hypothetical protein [Bacteroidales bacterium]
MKTKSFLLIALLGAFSIVSCGTRSKTVMEKLVGVWTGIDTIQIATYDSIGNISIETIAVPVAVEYFADTTMSGKVSYNDSTTANISAVVIVGEPYISYSGIMEINDAKQNLNGELVYNETPETLTMEFFSKNPATGQEHSGKALLTKKVAKQ